MRLIYWFGDCVLDTQQRELRRDGLLLTIEPRAFDLLEYLVRHRERVVGRDDVFAAVWHGRIVSDAALSTSLNAVRHAIGDDGAAQRLIRTFRRKGLRFVGAVEEAQQRDVRPAPRLDNANADGPVSPSYPSIAVLPFTWSSGVAEPRVSDDLAQAIIDILSRSGWLQVVAGGVSLAKRDTAVDIRRIGQQLNARYVLTGQIGRSSAGFHVSAELIDAVTGYLIGRETVNHAGDLSLIVRDIAESVTATIKARLQTAEIVRVHQKEARRLDAWECVLRAISLMNARTKSDWLQAQALLRRSIRMDSGYSQGYGLLSYAMALGVAAGWQNRKDAIDTSLELASKALMLNPEDAWAHLARGFALAWSWRVEDGILSYEKALECNPRLSYAHTLLAAALCYLGHTERATVHLAEAQRHGLSDLFARGNAGIQTNTYAVRSLILGQHRDGIDFGRKALAENPVLPTILRILIANCALSGELEEAQHVLRTLKRHVPATSLTSIMDWVPFMRREDAQKIAESFRLVGLK